MIGPPAARAAGEDLLSEIVADLDGAERFLVEGGLPVTPEALSDLLAFGIPAIGHDV